MGNLLITVGSVTTANRLNRILSGEMSVRIIHTPIKISGGGCSYSLITRGENLERVKRIVNQSGIKVKGYFMESEDRGEKGYYAIS